LLSLLGIPFVVKAAEVDERQLPRERPEEMVLRLSQAKARAVTDVRVDELVVAADTIVVLDGEVLGKPTGPDDAVRMLLRLRGRVHTVYSGVAVWHKQSGRLVRELGESQVRMRDYSDKELATYVDSGDPLDKAGAYAIQHPEFMPVSGIQGCRLSVMGLPLCHLGRALAQFGVLMPADVVASCAAFEQHECTVYVDIIGGGR
jgi:MAF protein